MSRRRCRKRTVTRCSDLAHAGVVGGGFKIESTRNARPLRLQRSPRRAPEGGASRQEGKSVMSDVTRENIDDFLGCTRLALAGVSRDSKDFSHTMFVDLRRRGYDVVPVNPNAEAIEGVKCFARVQDVAPPVEGVLVMTPAGQSEAVVRDCARAGVNRVWLHRGAGTGAVSPEAVEFCRQQGMSLVAGYCPYMFLRETPWFHRAHAFFMRVSGHYPNRAQLRI